MVGQSGPLELVGTKVHRHSLCHRELTQRPEESLGLLGGLRPQTNIHDFGERPQRMKAVKHVLEREELVEAVDGPDDLSLLHRLGVGNMCFLDCASQVR